MSIPNSQFISPPPLISWQPQVYFLYLKLYFCFIDKFICTLLKKETPHISSVTHSCPTLCNPMDCSTPGLPVHHQLPEFTQTHVRQVSDAIQPSHPLLSSSPPTLKSFPASGSFQMTQFFLSDGQSIGASASASVLPMNIQN